MLNKGNVFSKKLRQFGLLSLIIPTLSVLHAASDAAASSPVQSVSSPENVSDRNKTVLDNVDMAKFPSSSSLKGSTMVVPKGQSNASFSKAGSAQIENPASRKKVYHVTISEDFIDAASSKRSKNRRTLEAAAQTRPQSPKMNPEAKPCCCCLTLMRYLDLQDKRKEGPNERANSFSASQKLEKSPLREYWGREENHQKDLWKLAEDVQPGQGSRTEIAGEESWLLSPENGETLKQNLQYWCDQAHWKLVWKASCDYPVEADALFSGPFPDAVHSLIDAFKDAEIPLKASSYPKQRLIVISLY